MNNPRSRRSFVSKFSTGVAASLTLPRFAIGQSGPSANSKINVACVGIGHMGSYAVKTAAKENLVALCDVDWRPDRAIWGSRNPSEEVARYPGARTFTDFRAMLDRMGKDIDAVLVSTPDHTHFPIGMAAMESGKHVFIQKPLGRNIWQTRTLRKAKSHYGVKTVMGNQGHTGEGIRLVKEWVDGGVVGDVREVHCWTDRPMEPWFIKPNAFPPPSLPAPPKLNWDLWQGPVAERPYSEAYVTQRWRGWWDYGVGALGDIGCHCLDAPFWALQLGSPIAVDIRLDEPANDQFTPFGAHVTYHFPARASMPPVKLHWYEGRPRPPKLPGMGELPSNGMYMIGSKETIYHEDMRPNSPMLWPHSRMGELGDRLRQRTIPRVKGGPVEELFSAIKGDVGECGSNFDYAAPLTETILLGSMAIRAGHRIEWDADKMRITNRPSLNRWVKETVRPGWSYGEGLWT